MKIAVCDDDIAELNNICEILNNYFEEKKYDIYISKFGSSVELASIIQKEKFDIYILDIVMPVLSGMNLATEIRSFDKASDIIFLTSSPEFAVESYCVKATDYILKPVDKNRLLNSINEIAEKRKYEQEKYVVIKSNIGVHKIMLSNIICVEAQKHHVIYHLKNDEKIECTDKFSNVCEFLLNNHEFILVHRSFLVNMNYIRHINATDIYMQNSLIIPLAQRRVADIKRHYLAFQMEDRKYGYFCHFKYNQLYICINFRNRCIIMSRRYKLEKIQQLLYNYTYFICVNSGCFLFCPR